MYLKSKCFSLERKNLNIVWNEKKTNKNKTNMALFTDYVTIKNISTKNI